MQRLIFVVLFIIFLSGCASAVYQYDYERGNGIRYPQSISIGYYPTPSFISLNKNVSLSAGLDMSYLVVPMGTNIMIYNKYFFAGFRVGDQWSTSDNEALGANITIGGNYFLNNRSLLSLGASYTNFSPTPHDIVNGSIMGLNLSLQKILFSENKPSILLPQIVTLYISNNLYQYDVTGTVERPMSTDSGVVHNTYKLYYNDYLGSVGLGLNIKFSNLSGNIELGKIFPRYMYDIHNSNPIRYEAYLTTGLFLNF